MSAKDFKIRSILYPTDFTSGSIVSFCHALRIAVANRSSLHLLHVEVPGRRRDDAHFPRVRELEHVRRFPILCGIPESGEQ
nr:UspA domain containing universal stress protein [Methylocystis sp. SC2]